MELNKIYNQDCLEGMRELEDDSIDLIITDPPFFMPAAHYQSRKVWQRHYADLTPLKVFWDVICNEFDRILKRKAHCFVFCNCDSYPVFYEPMYNHFDKLKSLVWNKTRVGLGRMFRNQHELIIWARWKEHQFNNDGKLRADVLSFPATLSEKRKHPVEKPVELMLELIEPTTFEGDVVLDPFAGGGSVLMAAKRLNRTFIGFDLNQKYVEVANIQIKNSEGDLLKFMSNTL